MIQWMRQRRAAPRPWRWLAAAALALMADVRAAGAQSPFELYRERTAMLEAAARCHLFAANVTASLQASQGQARNAALRAGMDEISLDRAAALARAQAATVACNAPIMVREAQRVRSAYATYSELHRMSFPGDVGSWRADRTLAVHNPAWMLAQDAFAGPDRVVFGLAGREGAQAVTVAVAAPDGAEPYAARLILRDPARAPRPLIVGGDAPLSARVPVRGVARVILAEAKAPADRALLPAGVRAATAFRFPAETLAALQALDPREAVSVEFLYPSARADIVRTAFLEVGDLNAGMAFLRMGPK
jgi:hypothetical protein